MGKRMVAKQAKRLQSAIAAKDPRKHFQLGADYNTEWARTPVARAVRVSAIEGITRPLIKIIASPTVLNADRLDEVTGPVIFAANHTSHLDTSVMLSCLPPRFRHKSVVAAGADYFFDKHIKAFVWALWVNIIPIERERVGRRSADLAARLIGSGWNLVIFPEGTRSRDGFTAPFRGGAAYLGVRCNVPVVPVHIEGTRAIFGVGARRIRPGKTRVTFGEPLTALPNEKARDFNVRIEQAVARAGDEGRTDWWSAGRRSVAGETPSLDAPPYAEGWRRSWIGSKPAEIERAAPWPKR